MSTASGWIIVPIVVPLAAGIFTFISGRWAFAAALTAAGVNFVSVGILLRQLFLSGPCDYWIGGWQAPLGIRLWLDGPAALMLAMTAITGACITLYGRGYFSFRVAYPTRASRHERQQRYFETLWLLLWGAINGLFLSADIFNIYVTLELVAVAAAALTALSGRPASQIAALRYLMISLLGSLSYLLGLVFIYRTYGVLDLQLIRGLVAGVPAVKAALALMSVGLLLKSALFPMHFWLPPAHANALAPVSAILSGLVVKTSLYLLFRFWFEIFTPVVSVKAVTLLGILGTGAIIWGGLQAVRHIRLKMLIAYSTVSQIGYLFLAFPLAGLDGSTPVWSMVIFMALSHSCAKAAMFMAAGAIFLHVGHDRIPELAGVRTYLPVASLAFAIAGVNIVGLPPSGGFIAKWLLLSAALRSGAWWWGIIVMAGSFLAAAYIYRVIRQLLVIPENQQLAVRQPHSALLEWPALFLAVTALVLGLMAPLPLALLDSGNRVLAACANMPGGLP